MGPTRGKNCWRSGDCKLGLRVVKVGDCCTQLRLAGGIEGIFGSQRVDIGVSRLQGGLY